MLKFILKALLLFNSLSVCDAYVIAPVIIQKPMLKNNNNDLIRINMLELD